MSGLAVNNQGITPIERPQAQAACETPRVTLRRPIMPCDSLSTRVTKGAANLSIPLAAIALVPAAFALVTAGPRALGTAAKVSAGVAAAVSVPGAMATLGQTPNQAALIAGATGAFIGAAIGYRAPEAAMGAVLGGIAGTLTGMGGAVLAGR